MQGFLFFDANNKPKSSFSSRRRHKLTSSATNEPHTLPDPNPNNNETPNTTDNFTLEQPGNNHSTPSSTTNDLHSIDYNNTATVTTTPATDQAPNLLTVQPISTLIQYHPVPDSIVSPPLALQLDEVAPTTSDYPPPENKPIQTAPLALADDNKNKPSKDHTNTNKSHTKSLLLQHLHGITYAAC